MSKCEQCIVREFSALKSLNKSELIRMSECKTGKRIKKGEAIFSEGDKLNGIFCVRDGICKLTKLAPNGREQIIKLSSKGELLGQRSMISDEPANLSAVALEDMEVCFVPKSEIMGFFNENNKFSMSMMQSICGDLKEADDSIADLAQKTVRQRLAHTLLVTEEKYGQDREGFLRARLSREDLAGMVGTATENCIRMLSEFSREGYISLDGKKIAISDRKALQAIAD